VKGIMVKGKRKALTNPVVVSLMAVACCALWGSAFPGIKAGYQLFQIAAGDAKAQILFAGFRFFLAGILTLLIGSAAGKNVLKPRKDSWKRILTLSAFQTILQYVLFYIGLAHASGVKSSVIEGSGVFVTILVSCLVFRQERLTVRKIIGCALGFAGVVLVNTGGAGWNFSMSFLGEGFVFLSTTAAAVSSVLIKDYSQKDNPVMLSGYQFLCGGLFLMALGFFCGGRITHVTGKGLLILGYLAFLSAAAYSLWSILLKYNPVSRVAIWGFTNPVFGVVFSMIFLKETKQVQGLQLLLALLLVCLGIYTVNRPAGPDVSTEK